MKLMLTLLDATAVAEVDAFLSREVTVVGHEELTDVGAILSATGDAEATVAQEISGVRALWLVDAARETAVDLAQRAPGDAGTLELREVYTAEDFGGTSEPAPSVPRKPGTQRFIALLRADAASEGGMPPDPTSMAKMDAYYAPLSAAQTVMDGAGLKPSGKGSRIRRSAAQRQILDGPFTETKELIAGYMVVQTYSLEEAIDLVRPWLQIHRDANRVATSHIEVRLLR